MTSTGHDEGGILRRFALLAAEEPGAPFLAIAERSLSRAEFLAAAGRAAGALRAIGVGAGDTVVLCAANRVEWAEVFWGAVALGARPVPLDPAAGTWEMSQLLPHLSPVFAVATTGFRGGDPCDRLARAMPSLRIAVLDGNRPGCPAWKSLAAAAAPLDPAGRTVGSDEVLYYACTSGTTGDPKILAVPHRGFAKGQADMASHLGFSRQDHVLLGMPLFHQGGFGMGLQALLAGACASWIETFDPNAFLEAAEARRATVLQLSPTLAKLLLSVPGFGARDLAAVRMAYFAGETLPEDVAARFWRDMRARVVNVVGSSETGTMLAWDSMTDSDLDPSDLAALPFTAARVVDDATGEELPAGEAGVLWTRTDGQLLRYHGNPALTASSLRDGWYRTGDLVRRLPSGRLRFLGRLKRVVKRGPNLVHPEEVEAFLLGHPGIAAVAVGGESHPVYGESLVAWIQPVEGAFLARADVASYCRDGISSFKIPDRMHFVQSIPTDVGKIQHRRLRSQENAP